MHAYGRSDSNKKLPQPRRQTESSTLSSSYLEFEEGFRILLCERHTDASAVFFWWCTNPIDKLTSFPALNTLSKRFRYARATPSGIPKGLASYRVHQESQHRVRDQGESGSTAAPVVPIDTSGLTFDFSPPTEIVFLHNNPFPYIPTLHSVGLPHPANW